ncbi:MAG: alpha-L-rhamnosidase C-terminal domain-containing protein [Terriglobia bacterium]
MNRLKSFLPVSMVLVPAFAALVMIPPADAAQQTYGPQHLDLTASIAHPRLESTLHQPGPEQYIWGVPATASAEKTPFYFRKSFELQKVPASATLYAAGPDRMEVYLNGRLLANAVQDQRSQIRPFLLALNVSRALAPGKNLIAIMGSMGSRLVVKIIPAELEVMAPALVMTDGSWRWSLNGGSGWEQPGFDEHSWKTVKSLGGIESNIDFFQWNGDAGMYRWPGYDGISPFLARLPVEAQDLNYGFEGLGKFNNVKALEQPPAENKADEFSVVLPSGRVPHAELPFVILDFGRESTGRLQVISDSSASMKLEVQYGESLEEAMREPYLGSDPLDVPSHATAYGPKNAFRYALVRFASGRSPLRFRAIRLDDIYYPIHYLGSFESSDPLLNAIWRTGAYTSHLCMQDDIWDAPKRDRGRWMGDLDVSGRVIDTVFADHFLMEDTLNRLIAAAGNPPRDDVNSIPGYSAFWVMGEADYYRHSGNRTYLNSIHQPLIRLLRYMETEMNSDGLFANLQKHWPFVDWSPDLNGDTAEARAATTLEFYKAFSDGAWMLSEMGDAPAAAGFEAQAAAIKKAALAKLLDPQTNTLGSRWQTNAMAIFSGVAGPAQAASIWDKVLSQPHHFMITPYYNFYVIDAMAETGHRQRALDWIRTFWGGMIKEGATSFWEAYDPSWPKRNFHASLRADNGQGYFVSLAHGWSSGPTAWLTEQILGIQPQAPGFRKVTIRPDLAGLEWARGSEPTPHGAIKVDLRGAAPGSLSATITIPAGVDAQILMPVRPGQTSIQVNGRPREGTAAEQGTRLAAELSQAGTYELQSR